MQMQVLHVILLVAVNIGHTFQTTKQLNTIPHWQILNGLRGNTSVQKVYQRPRHQHMQSIGNQSAIQPPPTAVQYQESDKGSEHPTHQQRTAFFSWIIENPTLRSKRLPPKQTQGSQTHVKPCQICVIM